MSKQQSFLLDQNIPYRVISWLRANHTQYEWLHTRELGLQTADDITIYRWAVENQAVIITYDSDFITLGFLHAPSPGIIRLKVAPTSTAVTLKAL